MSCVKGTEEQKNTGRKHGMSVSPQDAVDLQPVQPTMVDIAGKSCMSFESFNDAAMWLMSYYKPFLDSLSVPERKVLSWYQGSGYDVLNHYLRTGTLNQWHREDGYTEADVAKRAKLMRGIFAKAPPLEENLMVYRGTNRLSDSEALAAPEQRIRDAAFLSTSLGKDYPLVAASRDEGRVGAKYLLRMVVPKGTRAIFLPVMQNTKKTEVLCVRELELVLPPTHQSQVISSPAAFQYQDVLGDTHEINALDVDYRADPQ